MSLLRPKKAQIREKRLGTLSAFLGNADKLLKGLESDDGSQKIRTFSQNTEDDIINVLRFLGSIGDSATVIHGPRGCGAALTYFNAGHTNSGRWAVTNLSERDTILGGDAKLRETVLAQYRRYRPEVIFIVASPSVAINNDDIQAVVEELSEELGVAIIPVYSDGFKSKTGLTGYDLASHAVAKYLVSGDEGETGDFINLISVTENKQDIAEIQSLLQSLGLKVNVLDRFASPQSFIRAGEARLSVSTNPDIGDYLGKALEETYSVPYIQSSLPIGINGTYQWLLAIGSALGLTSEAEQYHTKVTDDLKYLLEPSHFANLNIYINLPPSISFEVAAFVEELGGNIVGLSLDHIDKTHESRLFQLVSGKPDLQLRVAKGQPFEQANILQRLKPDLYIGGHGDAVWAARSGIPAVSVDTQGILGYRGVSRFIHQITKALQNQSFVQRLGKHGQLPYQSNWYQKSPNWYIKLEVK